MSTQRMAPTVLDERGGADGRASASVARHLARGAVGFGLIGAALALTPAVGPGALLLALPGMVALRGCPTCWIVGLLGAISAGRLERTCTESGCTLRTADTGRKPRNG
jgi:hypothetical protein